MRQAYDYWQDQPGSYFSTPPSRTGPRRYTASRKTPFPTVVHQIPCFKPSDPSPAVHDLSVYRRTRIVILPEVDPARSPRTPDLTRLRNASPSPSNKDRTLRRRLPAIGFTHDEVRTITADPQVIDRLRFGHRQAVHISLHRRPTLQTSTFGLPVRALSGTVARCTLLETASLTR